MNKIITAMGNETLNNELRKYAKYDVLSGDIICQDLLISKLKDYEVDSIIISRFVTRKMDVGGIY